MLDRDCFALESFKTCAQRKRERETRTWNVLVGLILGFEERGRWELESCVSERPYKKAHVERRERYLDEAGWSYY